MGRYRKDSYTLSVQVPADVGLSILGRLWATGIITKEQYDKKASQIDNGFQEREMRKHKKLEQLLKGVNKC